MREELPTAVRSRSNVRGMRQKHAFLPVDIRPLFICEAQARQGKARQGKARQGKARQGKASLFI